MDGPLPIGFDTDVNAPALAESLIGCGKGLSSCSYITVGTGVGVGLVVNGLPVHGLSHPEAGHIPCARLPNDTFPGTCVYHGACVEGLVSAVSLAARAGVDVQALPQVRKSLTSPLLRTA